MMKVIGLQQEILICKKSVTMKVLNSYRKAMMGKSNGGIFWLQKYDRLCNMKTEVT